MTKEELNDILDAFYDRYREQFTEGYYNVGKHFIKQLKKDLNFQIFSPEVEPLIEMIKDMTPHIFRNHTIEQVGIGYFTYWRRLQERLILTLRGDETYYDIMDVTPIHDEWDEREIPEYNDWYNQEYFSERENRLKIYFSDYT